MASGHVSESPCQLGPSTHGTKLPIQNVRSPVANGGKADNICSLRDLPVLTPSGGWAGRNLAPQRGADLILTARYAAPDLVGPADAI